MVWILDTSRSVAPLHHVLTGSMQDVYFFPPVVLFFPSAASSPCRIVRGLAHSPDISAAGRSHRPQRRPSAASLRGWVFPRFFSSAYFPTIAPIRSPGSSRAPPQNWPRCQREAVCEVTRRSLTWLQPRGSGRELPGDPQQQARVVRRFRSVNLS